MDRPVLFFDLGSPYAYLAVERAERLLGVAPVLEPVLLGAIFRLRGSGSWSQTPERDARIAEIERRAAAYGLPPLRWPAGWPNDGLAAMRAATWLKQEGDLDVFAREVFRRQFTEGADISDPAVLAAAADVPPSELEAAIADPAVKQALREATDAAWERGVRGVPTLLQDGVLRYGDDQLAPPRPG